MPTKVTVSVHERADGQPGFITKVTVEGEPARVVRFPALSRSEAEGLARSINQFMLDGYPIDLLLPEETRA
ncbi:MAG TPA: hypothetical protein PK313_13050 [Myxococcota bacterium]|nr:hypothetical protein [Myxococcota bacterium]